MPAGWRSLAAFEPASSKQTFQVVASDFAAHIVMGALGRMMAEEAPGTRLVLLPLSDANIERFGRGGIDLLVAPESVVGPSLQSATLFRDVFVVAGSAHFTRSAPLSAHEYFAADHVVAEPADVGRPGILDHFFAAGPSRNVAVRVPSFLAVADFVAGTNRIATLPRLLAEEHARAGRLRILDCAIALPELRERAHWPAHLERDHASLWLRDCMQRAARQATSPDRGFAS